MKLKVISTGSVGNSYLLGSENETLLIEAGVNFNDIKKALDFDLSKVVGCIVTHSHGDHAKSIREVMSAGIETFASQKTLLGTLTLLHHNAFEITPGKTHHIGRFKVMGFEVKHDVPCLGFLIEHPECGKTLFLTDTFYCKYTFEGLNNIIIEANYSKEIIDRKYGKGSDKEFLIDRILQSHFSLDNCKDMLSANDLSKVNNIVLIHLSDSNSNEVQFVKEVSELTGKNVVAAVKGLEIEFNIHPF